MPIFRGDTSRGVHIRALKAALEELLSLRLQEPPKPGGVVALRDHINALVRAYPREFEITDTDVLQMLAEEDGLAHEDAP